VRIHFDSPGLDPGDGYCFQTAKVLRFKNPGQGFPGYGLKCPHQVELQSSTTGFFSIRLEKGRIADEKPCLQNYYSLADLQLAGIDWGRIGAGNESDRSGIEDT
jgi:hypothetical protein